MAQQELPLVVVIDHLGRFVPEEIVGDALVVLGPDPEMKVRTQRSGDLAPEERADVLPAHATHDLTDQESEGIDVVSVRPPGLPPGLFRREGGGHELPIVHGKALIARAADLGDVGHGRHSSDAPGPWYYPPVARADLELERAFERWRA